MQNIFFTLNNIRGLRRYLKLKHLLKNFNFNVYLITPSLSTYLTAKILNKEVILSTSVNYKIIETKNLINNIDINLITSSINAELDQELNYGLSIDGSKKILNFFLKLKASKFYLIYMNTINKIENLEVRDILGFNSNLINQVSSCMAAEYLKINFISIASILPPDVVGLTQGLPYLRNIVFCEPPFRKNYLQNEKLNKPLSNKSASAFWSKRFASFYLNKFEDTLRRGLSKITLIIDDIFNNFSSLIFFIKSFRLINYGLLSSKIISNLEIRKKIFCNKNDFKCDSGKNKNLNYFDGMINDNSEYHIYYLSCPLESENYFPGLDNEYNFLSDLSKKYFKDENKKVIARLHPGFELMYSREILLDISKKGILIWDKRHTENFNLSSNSKTIKYTNCSTIFFESLGTESACIVTSEALKSCKDFLDQPDPLNSRELSLYIQSWKLKSMELKEFLRDSLWIQNYFDPKVNYDKKAIKRIVNSL